MNANQKQVQIAAQLYEIRDKAKWLLGDKYAAHMAELGRILKDTAERTGSDVLKVATDVCRKRNLGGMDLLVIMAAAVELIEPSVRDAA